MCVLSLLYIATTCGSDKTGTLTMNQMSTRMVFIGDASFGSPDSEIAVRVQQRMSELRAASPGGSAAVAGSSPRHAEAWTSRVSKLKQQAAVSSGAMPLFDAAERVRLLQAMWGPLKRDVEAGVASVSSSRTAEQDALAAQARRFCTHMAISNTITPEVKQRANPSGSAVGEAEYVFNSSSPDELALCEWASLMGFQFQSRSKDGVTLSINKQGYGDDVPMVEVYQQLGILDFTSKRKRVTCIYLRDGFVHIMCKGADSTVLPLLRSRPGPAGVDDARIRSHIELQLNDMATRGLRTLVVASATLPESWWFGAGGLSEVYKGTNLPDRGAEKDHHRGSCDAECRICAGLAEIERRAGLELLGATAVEDRLQDLVPECIADFLSASIKVWMLTGDRRLTAMQIALACNLIDPDMERAEVYGSLAADDLNRIVQISGDSVSLCSSVEQLRVLFDILDSGGDIVDGVRTNFISRAELRMFLVATRVPGMESDAAFDVAWSRIDREGTGKMDFNGFREFMARLQPSTLRAVQTDIELGLRKARLIAGDGSPEERRHKLERMPLSLVIEGEALAALFPEVRPRGRPGQIPVANPVAPHAAGAARAAAAASGSPAPSAAPSDARRSSFSPRLNWNEIRSSLPLRGLRTPDEDEGLSEPEAVLLREAFFELASMCKSVICCRLTPAQKGRIVSEFTRKGHVTLAIGGTRVCVCTTIMWFCALFMYWFSLCVVLCTCHVYLCRWW